MIRYLFFGLFALAGIGALLEGNIGGFFVLALVPAFSLYVIHAVETDGKRDAPLSYGEKTKVIVTEIFNPIVTGSFYYHCWKREFPLKAKQANRYSFVILGLWMMVTVLGSMGIGHSLFRTSFDWRAGSLEFRLPCLLCPESLMTSVRRVAERGDADAQATLGTAYMQGIGIDRDVTLALHWLGKAAAQGNQRAQRTLGVLYLEGRGVAVDYAEAAKWFGTASANDDIACANCLAWLLATCPDDGIRNGAQALAIAEQVVAKQRVSMYLDTLAAALAEVGRFDDAVRTQQEAIARLSAEAREAQVIGGYRERLDAYRAQQPWRKP